MSASRQRCFLLNRLHSIEECPDPAVQKWRRQFAALPTELQEFAANAFPACLGLDRRKKAEEPYEETSTNYRLFLASMKGLPLHNECMRLELGENDDLFLMAKLGYLVRLKKALHPPLMVTRALCTEAAIAGHLHILKWLYSLGGEAMGLLEPMLPNYIAELTNGDIEVFKWLVEEAGLLADWDTYEIADVNDNWKIVGYGRDHGFDV